MAFGACAASGGFYDNYATVRELIVSFPSARVYVPGCPPRPEAVLDEWNCRGESRDKSN